MVPVGALEPHPRNVNESNLGEIIESIKHNRFYGAVVVQRSSSRILAGKHRWLAARECGLELVPVIWADVSDEEALRIVLVDNRSCRLGHDEPNALAALLQELANDGGLQGTGFSPDDLDELLAELAAPMALDGQDESGRLSEAFQVLVTCSSEGQQADLLERLNGEGYQCRALIS